MTVQQKFYEKNQFMPNIQENIFGFQSILDVKIVDKELWSYRTEAITQSLTVCVKYYWEPCYHMLIFLWNFGEWKRILKVLSRFTQNMPSTLSPLLNFFTTNCPSRAVYESLTLENDRGTAKPNFATTETMFLEWNLTYWIHHKMACSHCITKDYNW